MYSLLWGILQLRDVIQRVYLMGPLQNGPKRTARSGVRGRMAWPNADGDEMAASLVFRPHIKGSGPTMEACIFTWLIPQFMLERV